MVEQNASIAANVPAIRLGIKKLRPDINKFCTATDSTAYLAPYQPVNVAYRIGILGVYTATEKRPDFKLIRKRFLPKCVCLRGSAPDPAGGLTAPPDPQLEKVGLHTNPSHRCQPSRIRRDSPAFSSDVPRSREISRCPAFFENGIIIFSVAD